jgi:hypothetical protein
VVSLLLALLAMLAPAPPATTPLRLPPGVPIYIADQEPEPVRRAAKDLQRDLNDVLGRDSPLVNRFDAIEARPAIVIVGPASGDGASRHPAITGREAHGVFVRGEHVVLQGADARGTTYAIYTFSERLLGIPPCWFWASWKPLRQDAVTVAAGTELVFESPSVRFRAWFPNDTDLLSPWRARAPEHSEAILETMLRLKLNTLEGGMMDAGSFDRPYTAGRLPRLARDRGLALTGHHMLIFGSDYGNWSAYWTKIRHREPPGLAIANVTALEDFWRYHIETGLREKLEMIWLIGFRGDRDIPFWETFRDAPASDAARARVIEEMMARQVALLKEVTKDPAPLARVTLYNENSDFFAQGLLRPPDEPNLIWTFVAARRDHFPAEDVRRYRNDANRPIGYYMNFQFTSSGAHLAQAEGPWKMEQNFRMVNHSSGRPLEFSVVNAGNIREFLLELSANAAMMNDLGSYRTDGFLEQFCGQYFGPANGAAVAALYRDFYDAYWTQKKPDLPGFDRQYVFQDQRYARAIESILAQLQKGRNLDPLDERAKGAAGGYFRIVPQDNGAANQVDAILHGTSAAIERLTPVVARADALRPVIAEQGRSFFNDHLRVQAHFMLHLNRALQSVAGALAALPDKGNAARSLRSARESLGAIKAVLHEAEHDRFTGWYDGDRLFGVSRLTERVDAAIGALGGDPSTAHVPGQEVPRSGPPAVDDGNAESLEFLQAANANRGDPTQYTSPVTAARTFLAALEERDLKKVAAATALRAATESKNKALFQSILAQKLGQEDLDELARKLSGYELAGTSAPTVDITRIVATRPEGNGIVRRTLTMRREKAGWKLQDISDEGALAKPITVPRIDRRGNRK